MPYKNKADYNAYMREYQKNKNKQRKALEQQTVQLAEALSISFRMNLERGKKHD